MQLTRERYVNVIAMESEANQEQYRIVKTGVERHDFKPQYEVFLKKKHTININ